MAMMSCRPARVARRCATRWGGGGGGCWWVLGPGGRGRCRCVGGGSWAAGVRDGFKLDVQAMMCMPMA